MDLFKSFFKAPLAALGVVARIATAAYVILLIGLFTFLIIKIVITAGGLI